MTDNDINLIRQMMKAGRHQAVYDFMPEYNLAKSQAIIKEMGDKWCCHPSNAVKRLAAPLEILKQHQSTVLRRNK